MFVWLLYALATITTLFVVRILYRFLIKPYILLTFYRKQGIPTEFYPIWGHYAREEKNLALHNDFYRKWKEYANSPSKPAAFASNLGSEVIVFPIETGMIKEICNHYDQYEKHPDFFYLIRKVGGGIAWTEGERWKKHRKSVSMAFHYDLLKEMVPKIVQITQELFDNMKKKNNITNIRMMREIQVINGEVIGRLFFGEQFHEYRIEGVPVSTYISDIFAEVGTEVKTPAYLLLGPKFFELGILPRHAETKRKFYKYRETMKAIIEKKMKEREELDKKGESYKGQRTMLDYFYEIRRDSPEHSLSETEIVNTFGSFFHAGVDNVGHSAAEATFCLLEKTDDDFKRRLKKECLDVFKNTDNISIDDLNRMPLAEALIKETLRFMTPLPQLAHRVALKDHELGGLKIKKGTSLSPALLCNNYSNEYHDDPETFSPDRWIDPNSKTNVSVAKDPFVFTPFSMGARNCLGKNLAMFEGKIIIGLLLKNFTYKLSDPKYVLRMKQTFLFEPIEDIKYNLTPI